MASSDINVVRYATFSLGYYEVSQHEKFRFNIRGFKRLSNADLCDQK
jgi:hypothetical protein